MDRALTRVALVLCVVLGAPVWAGAAPRRLVSVELHGESTGRWLSITSDRPPNFTSFKLGHPSRVVVDFPETAAVASKQTGPDDGLVAGWSVQPLGSDSQVVARLTVELRKDADYTLTSSGNGVELRFVSSLARPLVALENEHVEPQVAPTPTAPEAPVPVSPAVVTVSPAEKARLAKEARLAAAAEQKRTEDEARRQAVEAARARKAALLAEAEAKQARLAETQRRQREAVVAAAAAKREKEAEARRQQAAVAREKAERVAAARHQKEEAARTEADRLAALKRTKAERAAELTAQRAAAAKAEKERVATLARQRAADAQAAREKIAADKRQKAEAAEETRLARLRAVPVPSSDAPAPDAAPKHVATFGQMGFRRVSNSAEVLLHTSHPVDYSMREEEGRVILTLEHTRILVANNKLALETSYFGTPVARVIPHDRPHENRVEVEFVLSTTVPYEIKPDGDALTILFRNPPVVRAEADPAPGMTAEP